MSGRLATPERLLRGGLGVGLLVWAYVGESVWGLLGLLLIANAVAGWCGAYAATGWIGRRFRAGDS